MGSFYFYKSLNGDQITKNDLAVFQNVINAYPHDSNHYETLNSIGAGCTCSNLSQNYLSESGFLIHGKKGIYFLVGDIRIYNRKEICSLLNCKKNDDRELFVEVYETYSDKITEHLIGDFGCVLYDLQNHETIIIRDHLGVIPVYYYLCENFLLISDTIDVMLSHSSIPKNLNEKVILKFIANGHHFNTKETFYTHILKIPRATISKLKNGILESTIYWHPESIQPLTYKTEKEYIDHLSGLLKRVVSDRIEPGTIGAHLSGGLDSSPIAVLAGREALSSANSFYTYNWCRPEPDDDKPYHEWSDAREIANLEGFTHSEIDFTVDYAKTTLEEHDISRHGSTTYEYERILLPLAKKQGVKQIFSGFGGDELFTIRARSRNTDLIRKGKWLKALKLSYDQTSKDRLTIPHSLFYFGKSLLYTFSNKQEIKKTYSHSMNRAFAALLRIVNPKFKDSLSLMIKNKIRSRKLNIREQQLFNLDKGYHQARIECWNALGKKHGIRYVYPLLDKRIVEFALALPEQLYYKNGLDRYLYRKAIEPLIPGYLTDKRKPKESYRVQHLIKVVNHSLKDFFSDKQQSSSYFDTDEMRKEYLKLQLEFEKNDWSNMPILITLLQAIRISKMVDKNNSPT